LAVGQLKADKIDTTASATLYVTVDPKLEHGDGVFWGALCENWGFSCCGVENQYRIGKASTKALYTQYLA